MKRKLVAALLSVAMVASITPVSALGPVASVEAATNEEVRAQKIQAFKDAMGEFTMAQNLALITTDSVELAYGFYEKANAAYVAAAEVMTSEDLAENDALIKALDAAKDKIISVYAQKMIADIDEVAQKEKVTKDETFATIKADEEKLAAFNITGAELKKLVTNYSKYVQAQEAKTVDYCIDWWVNNVEGLTDQQLVDYVDNPNDARVAVSEESRAMAKSYALYLEAKARLDQNKSADTIVSEATTRLNERKGVLNKERTSARVEEAEAEITKSEAAVKDVREKASATVVAAYDKAITELKALVADVKAELKTQGEADEYSKKIDTLYAKTITVDDIADIEELYNNVNKYGTQLTADARIKAQNILGQWAKLVKATPDGDVAFTNAVIKAFPVPDASAVKHTQADKNAIDKALDVLSSVQTIAGVDVSKKLATTDSSYIAAKAKAIAAKIQWEALDDIAQQAENTFTGTVTAIANNIINNDYYKTHLGTAKGYLDTAKAQYDALDDYSKNRVKAAYAQLNTQIKTYETYVARLSEEKIIADLTSGLKAIESKVNDKKLTIADKDLVYGYRDSFNALSKAAQEDFKTNHHGEYATLTAAINQIDNLVVVDLEKQIDALVKVKPDATLAEIQAAKAANKAARDAYNALTDTQQGAVSNFKLIAEAEQAVKDAEVAYVKGQIKEIVRIDLSKLTVDQAKNIVEVQSIINGMDDTQKNSIFSSTVGKADYEKALAAAVELVKKAASLENATISAVADQTYTGEDIQPAVEVKDMSGAVIAASEYKVAYKNNVDAGTATVVVSAVDGSQYTGTKELEFTIKPADASGATVSAANVTYTGEELETTVKVVLDGKTLKAGTDYDVTYADTTKVGKATATVTAKGNYAGTITKNFVVKPGKSAVTSFKAGTKKAVVKFNGQPGASYKIAYALAGTTQYKYAYTTSLSKTLTGLKSGRTYKVKVLAYYKADGKTYYTGYGSYKTVKVK